MNLRNIPKPSETLEELHMLLEYHKLVLEDAYKMRDRSLETIKELEVKIATKHHKVKVGMIVYAFHCDQDRKHYLDGKEQVANRAEIVTIHPRYDLEDKPHLTVKYLEDKQNSGHEGNIYDLYSYWEHIKD